MTEILETNHYIYRHIPYTIRKWELGLNIWKYGYELITNNFEVEQLLGVLEQLGYDATTDSLLYDDAQHHFQTKTSDKERIEYLHSRAHTDIDTLWYIHDNLYQKIREKIENILHAGNMVLYDMEKLMEKYK